MNDTVQFTAEDELVLQSAAHGAVALMAAANPGAISSSKAGIAGGKALSSTTGPVGHVLARKPRGMKLGGDSTAELADQVLAALDAAVTLLERKAPAEVEGFRAAITVAVDEAGLAHGGGLKPAEAEMARKIAAALRTDKATA